MLCIDGERKRQGRLCLRIACGQSWGQMHRLIHTYIYIWKSHASCMTRWARSVRQLEMLVLDVDKGPSYREQNCKENM